MNGLEPKPTLFKQDKTLSLRNNIFENPSVVDDSCCSEPITCCDKLPSGPSSIFSGSGFPSSVRPNIFERPEGRE